MVLMTERVIQDGFWFLLLTAVLAYFWFHRRRRSQASRSNPQTMRGQEKNEPPQAGKKTA